METTDFIDLYSEAKGLLQSASEYLENDGDCDISTENIISTMSLLLLNKKLNKIESCNSDS